MKKLLTLLLGCTMYATGHAQYTPAPLPVDTLIFNPVSPTDLWKVHYEDEPKPRHTPQKRTALPTCSYINGQICMTTKEDWGSFTYYILSGEDETVLTGSGFLTSCAPYYIDLSPLEPGCYTFVLQHGGYYGAAFAY